MDTILFINTVFAFIFNLDGRDFWLGEHQSVRFGPHIDLQCINITISNSSLTNVSFSLELQSTTAIAGLSLPLHADVYIILKDVSAPRVQSSIDGNVIGLSVGTVIMILILVVIIAFFGFAMSRYVR